MTWQIFTVIQIGVFAVAAMVAMGIRNHRLRRDNEQLQALCAHAHEALANVTARLTEIETTLPPEKLLEQRLKGLIGNDDPVTAVRRAVLENEIKPAADFAQRLSEHLASHDEPPDEQEFVRRWRAIREECQQLAMFLVADHPDTLPAVRQLFEVLEPIDHAYGIDMPTLAVRRETPAGDEADGDTAAGDTAAGAERTDATARPDDGSGNLDQDAVDALLSNRQEADEASTEVPARTGTG